MRHFFVAVLAITLTGLGPRASAQFVDGVRAIVHDSVITHYEVEAMTATGYEALVRQYRNQPETLRKKLDEAERDNLDQLVGRQLVLQEFKSFNVPESIIDAEVDREIEAEIKSRFGDRIRMIRTLNEEGLTLERYRQHIRDRMIVSYLTQKNVASEVIISPHKVETYYLAHRDDEGYKLEDQVKLRMIVLNKTDQVPEPKTLAEELRTKLKEGASFGELAGIYSQGSQRKEMGLWGWADKKQLRKELSDVAFSLKPGEYSEVIEIKEGDKPASYYLMFVEEKQSAHYKSLGEIRDEIEKNLLLEERSRLYKQWIAKLKKKNFVQYRQ